jgi:membrane-associated phospholipid phosphatase
MPAKTFDALIAALMAAMLALASSGANAQSTLSDETAQELQRLLGVQEGKVAVPYSVMKPPRTPADTYDRYLMWNEIALDTTAIDHTPVAPGEPACRFGEQFGPHRASRAMAIIHIAMFDAVNAIAQTYVSYSGISAVSGDVSEDRAIAQAAYETLAALYPCQGERIEAIFDQDIASITGTDTAIEAGEALGKQAAAAILALRQNDGSQLPEPKVMESCSPGDVTCFPANHEPGKWESDPISKLTVALGANWGQVKPFVMTSADQFRTPVPPSLSDDAYRDAFWAVYRIGGDPEHGTPSIRTPEQTHIAKFWGYDGTPNLCAPPRLYNQIVRTIALQQKMLTVPEISRLLALVNTAMADAAIAAWESKYYYQYWRPVTGIRKAKADKNSHGDPDWYPLGAPDTNTKGPNFTPPFPTYPSGHATIGGALFEILRKFWPDNTPFTFVSDEWNGKNKDVDGYKRPRWPISYASFTDAERENAQSRVYLGIHWQFDADYGIREGNMVGDYVYGHAFQPAGGSQ